MPIIAQWQEAAKFILPSIGIAIAVLMYVLRSSRFDFQRGLLLAALFWTAVAGAFFYNNAWNQTRYLNCYEFFHYYLGSKYAPELGYSDLYEAALVAQKEAGQRDLPTSVRDLVHGRSVPAAQVLQNAEAHKARFSPARWEEFKGDVLFFRSYFRGGWNKMMNDKGYNPPPTWTMMASLLSNQVPTSSYYGMLALASIDLLLMLAAALAVTWAFGPRAALYLALILFTQYVSSHTHMKAAFIRTDWVMFLVIAACLIKKECWIPAGVLLAWATCSRIFPAIFAFGLGAKFLLDLVLERRINRDYLRFLIAFGVAGIVFVGASWLEFGTAYWQEFLTKIADHDDDISAWRVGFKYIWLLSYKGASIGAGALANQYMQTAMLYHAIQLAVLLLAIPLMRRIQPWQAFCFGFVPVFLLVAPTYYYYIVILVPALYFAADPTRLPNLIGLLLIFAEGMAAHYGHRLWDRSFQQFFLVSAMMMVIALYLCALAAATFLPRRETPPAEA